MEHELDLKAYERGKEAFTIGKDLLHVFSVVKKASDKEGISFALGFADCVLDRIRAIS